MKTQLNAELFNLLAELRNGINEVIFNIADSGISTVWDDDTPNRMTKRKIEILLKKNQDLFKQYGIKITFKEYWEYIDLSDKRNKLITEVNIKKRTPEKDMEKDSQEQLYEVCCDICEAHNYSNKGKTRSKIRELLLRAILRTNDLLLPQPMDVYIKNNIR